MRGNDWQNRNSSLILPSYSYHMNAIESAPLETHVLFIYLQRIVLTFVLFFACWILTLSARSSIHHLTVVFYNDTKL
jgi:hypothetical protein